LPGPPSIVSVRTPLPNAAATGRALRTRRTIARRRARDAGHWMKQRKPKVAGRHAPGIRLDLNASPRARPTAGGAPDLRSAASADAASVRATRPEAAAIEWCGL